MDGEISLGGATHDTPELLGLASAVESDLREKIDALLDGGYDLNEVVMILDERLSGVIGFSPEIEGEYQILLPSDVLGLMDIWQFFTGKSGY